MSGGHSTVLFHVPARGLSRRGLHEFANSVQDRVTAGRPFCCLIASDGELRDLNRQFRKKDHATDVLSFRSADRDGSLGELAISWDRARAQAAAYGHSAEEEVRILLLHGALHLAGFDHEKDRGEMARAERLWRKRLNLPNGLIARVGS